MGVDPDRKPQDAEQRVEPGRLVRGVVTRVEHFGAFVDLGASGHGLISITDLKDGPPVEPEDWPHIGAEVEAVVVGVNGHDIRLSLRPSLLRGAV